MADEKKIPETPELDEEQMDKVAGGFISLNPFSIIPPYPEIKDPEPIPEPPAYPDLPDIFNGQ